MPIETVTGIQDLNPSWPTGVDPVSEGDDHARLTKDAIQKSFPGMVGPWQAPAQKPEFAGMGANDEPITEVGAPVDPTDAARKFETDALDTRVSNIEGQIATFVSFGNVDENGTIQGGSGDFSVVRLAAGNYQVTFTEAASGAFDQVITANVQGSPPFVDDKEVNISYQSPTVAILYTVSGNNQEQDAAFTFQRLAS